MPRMCLFLLLSHFHSSNLLSSSFLLLFFSSKMSSSTGVLAAIPQSFADVLPLCSTAATDEDAEGDEEEEEEESDGGSEGESVSSISGDSGSDDSDSGGDDNSSVGMSCFSRTESSVTHIQLPLTLPSADVLLPQLSNFVVKCGLKRFIQPDPKALSTANEELCTHMTVIVKAIQRASDFHARYHPQFQQCKVAFEQHDPTKSAVVEGVSSAIARGWNMAILHAFFVYSFAHSILKSISKIYNSNMYCRQLVKTGDDLIAAYITPQKNAKKTQSWFPNKGPTASDATAAKSTFSWESLQKVDPSMEPAKLNHELHNIRSAFGMVLDKLGTAVDGYGIYKHARRISDTQVKPTASCSINNKSPKRKLPQQPPHRPPPPAPKPSSNTAALSVSCTAPTPTTSVSPISPLLPRVLPTAVESKPYAHVLPMGPRALHKQQPVITVTEEDRLTSLFTRLSETRLSKTWHSRSSSDDEKVTGDTFDVIMINNSATSTVSSTSASTTIAKLVAIKTFKDAGHSWRQMEALLLRERALTKTAAGRHLLLSGLNTSFGGILTYIDVIRTENDCCTLVSPLARGNLLGLYAYDPAYDMKPVVVRQLLSTLANMHHCRLVHGSITPRHILFMDYYGKAPHVVFTDFLSGGVIPVGDSELIVRTAGNKETRAPELDPELTKSLTFFSISTFAGDVFSLAMSLITWFRNSGTTDIVYDKVLPARLTIDGMASADTIRIACLSQNSPALHPSLVDLLQRMTHPDPTRRITALEALLHPYVCS